MVPSYNGGLNPGNRFFVILIYVWIALPLFIFGLAWRKYYQDGRRVLILPTLSATLLLLAVNDPKVGFWVLTTAVAYTSRLS
jgi:hypothetical protein